MNSTTGDIATSALQCFCVNKVTPEEIRVTSTDEVFIVWLMSQHRKTFALLILNPFKLTDHFQNGHEVLSISWHFQIGVPKCQTSCYQPGMISWCLRIISTKPLNTIVVCKVLNIYLALCNQIRKYSGFAAPFHLSVTCFSILSL